MAKALLGYSTGTDLRGVNRLAVENHRLRRRVADLEDIVGRLQKENDALAELVTDSVDEAVKRDSHLARA